MTPQWIMGVIFFVAALAGGAVWFFISHKQYHSALWIGFFIVVAILLNVTLYIRNEIVQREIQAQTPVFYGELVPGNEPTPELPSPLPPGIPRDMVFLFLGNNVIATDYSESLVLSKGEESFLSISIKSGKMYITADLFDSNNNRIAKIIQNEFQANPDYAFNPKQPDAHSLVVRDMQGVEVLNVRFLNPRAIRISGRFHMQGYSEPVVVMQDGALILPGNNILSGCMFVQNGSAIHFQ